MRTTSTLPGLTLTDLTLQAPLDHADPAAGTIEVFARDFDGNGKAQVRLLDGRLAIVPGSKLQKVTL